MKNPIIKRLIWIVIFAALVYTAFFIWSDVRQNISCFRQFPWFQLPVIIGAVLVNFFVRELKWDFYRRRAGLDVPRSGSFLVFFSGYSMCISPGRVGELIKPFMYKEYFGLKMRRTIPLVFCERVSDLLGMIIIGGIAVPWYMAGVRKVEGGAGLHPNAIYGFLGFSAVFMVVLILLVRWRSLIHRLIGMLSFSARLDRSLHKVRELYDSTYPLLTVPNLAIATSMAAFSWAFECVALLMILHGVGASQVTLGQAAFVFCMSTIFGGFLFFLPGGLGGFEASMAIMLSLIGVLKAQASSATFIIRLCTLFFGVGLGFLFILYTSAKYHKRMQWEEFAEATDAEEE